MFGLKPASPRAPFNERRPVDTATLRMSWRAAFCWLLIAVALVCPEGSSFGGPAQGKPAVSRKLFTPAYFELAARWEVDGVADRGLVQLAFWCDETLCTLDVILFSRCIAGTGSVPISFQEGTDVGTLLVRQTADTFFVTAKELAFNGNIGTNLAFRYKQGNEGGLPTLVGFSGATVGSASMKLVPLPKLYQEVQLNCGVSLKGLPSGQ
jgi:hypothetical protein